jgi:hypothetical protein
VHGELGGHLGQRREAAGLPKQLGAHHSSDAAPSFVALHQQIALRNAHLQCLAIRLRQWLVEHRARKMHTVVHTAELSSHDRKGEFADRHDDRGDITLEEEPADIGGQMVDLEVQQTAFGTLKQLHIDVQHGQREVAHRDLASRRLRRTETFGRLGLLGLLPRPVYDAVMWCTFSGVPLPPPFRDAQHITLALDAAVNGVLDDRIAHPTDSADLLNVLLHADNGTWPRRRIRDVALTFMLAGHETTANAMSWFWYLMALNRDPRERMLAEDDLIDGHHVRPVRRC